MDTTLKGQDIAANPIIQGKNNNNSRRKKNKTKRNQLLFCLRKDPTGTCVCPWDVLGIETGYNK